jgi:alpha-D-ribose 1-methylphosphonate 5-triphosphate diphosphatase
MTTMAESSELVLRNARIVLPDREVDGALIVRNGRIAEISGPVAAGEDMEGDTLIPGLVELHTDHVENHFAPRAGVRWNSMAAVQAHDAQIAASGITTVFDALRLGSDEEASIGARDMAEIAAAIRLGNRDGRLRAAHFIHLRCEVSAPDCLAEFEHFRGNDDVRLISVMDHAPGQRQFAQMEHYRHYYQRKLKLGDEDFAAFVKRRSAESAANSDRQRATIGAYAREHDIVLASHDDATPEHVEEAVAQGIRIAEFPTTAEAARASHQAGMSVLMGAPNMVRGSSHSGNVSARELAEAGLLDIMSSDYIPFSLIQAAFSLERLVDGISLPEAVALVARNPAQATGLDDRGEIVPGKRADLVRVGAGQEVPIVRSVWREGRRVL